MTGSAMANKRPYAGSPFKQSSHDVFAEITGSSRYDDGRVIHDSDIREDSADANEPQTLALTHLHREH